MQKKSFTVDEIKKKLEYYCAYQERCHIEVEQKIREYNLIPEAREYILLSLIKDNFLNEERFAKSFVRGKFRIKHWGKKRIIKELKHKDISDYNIKKSLEEINQQEYLQKIYTIAKKKNNISKETDINIRKKKLINFLILKGYETELIYKTINEIVL